MNELVLDEHLIYLYTLVMRVAKRYSFQYIFSCINQKSQLLRKYHVVCTPKPARKPKLGLSMHQNVHMSDILHFNKLCQK